MFEFEKKMISPENFQSGMALLCAHFNRDLLPPVIAIWREYLDKELNNAEFSEAIKHVLLHSQFFPTAGQLVEAIKSSKEARAIQEWESVLRASANSRDSASLAYLSDRARAALQSIGGLNRLGMTEDEWVRNRMQKNFVTVYCQLSERDSKLLPPASSVAATSPTDPPQDSVPPPEYVRAEIQALKAKMTMNGSPGK